MADVSLTLDTTEYPLTVVNGTTLTLSLNGASGPSGPTGPNSSVLSVAGRTGAVTLASADITDATSAATANTLVKRTSSGTAFFSGVHSGSVLYLADLSNAGTEARMQSDAGVFTFAYDFQDITFSVNSSSRTITMYSGGPTRTYTFPASTGTIALIDLAQSWSSAQTFNGAFEASSASLKLSTSLPIYADNTAASTANHPIGRVYRTGSGQLMIRY